MTDTGPASTDGAAQTVADTALSVPGVAELHGGQFGEVGTYLPGKRITGVVLDETSCAVHISVKYPANVLTVAEQVRQAVGQVVDVPITITVGDVVVDGDGDGDGDSAEIFEERN
ncbi:Asp23/Gls24 family envelope stress response protein [Rhodococcus sp. ARC_M6]|uniref:Asp23/Gls24 family envelope stress response protein n=1 Tax=Rhodococcus sp. ARC_M6 TaxID=2928852 RepID=UPI001FB40304|nr:Asp23/Gls24 family envelope stress response protein [Rhodococcus sp. ARC_M6]MCJ0903943.1 Asp23/Gls24 family envelope stress response protein [Rhodococcus sp. ARC_M6]